MTWWYVRARAAAGRDALAERSAEGRLRAAIVRGAREMHAEGLVLGSVGNVSARAGAATPGRRDARILVTPTRHAYDLLRPRDVAAVALGDGAALAGAPSRELPLHLAIYRARPDVGAVVHTHSRWATAWSFLGEDLAADLEEMAYHGIGDVRTSPCARVGSAELGAHGAAALGANAAALLGRHGVVAVASSVPRALDVARVVEAQAHAAWLWRLDAASRSGDALPEGALALLFDTVSNVHDRTG